MSTATFIASQRTDHVAPMGSVEPGHGQAYEQVAQPGGMEHAGTAVGGIWPNLPGYANLTKQPKHRKFRN